MQEYSKTHSLITLNDLNFEVISYKVNHNKMVSHYITMTNNTKIYTNGIRPYELTIKGYFPKTNGNDIILTLEELLKGSKLITFNLNSIKFENVCLSRYALNEDINAVFQECEISFVGVTDLQTASTTEE